MLTKLTLHNKELEHLCQEDDLSPLYLEQLKSLGVLFDRPAFRVLPQALVSPFNLLRGAVCYKEFYSLRSTLSPADRAHYVDIGIQLGFSPSVIKRIIKLIGEQEKDIETIESHLPDSIPPVEDLLSRDLEAIRYGTELAQHHGSLGYIFLALSNLFFAQHIRLLLEERPRFVSLLSKEEKSEWRVQMHDYHCSAFQHLYTAQQLLPVSTHAMHNGLLGTDPSEYISRLLTDESGGRYPLPPDLFTNPASCIASLFKLSPAEVITKMGTANTTAETIQHDFEKIQETDPSSTFSL